MMHSSSNSNVSRDAEKTSASPVDDPELLNQPPFNIPPGTGGARPSGLLHPPGNDGKSRSRSSLAGLRGRGMTSTPRVDGKRELTEDECYDILAYSWPKWKKWGFLSVCITCPTEREIFPPRAVSSVRKLKQTH